MSEAPRALHAVRREREPRCNLAPPNCIRGCQDAEKTRLTELPHDPLLERLRAADPGRARPRTPGSGRARVVVAYRRRRARRARGLGVACTVVAVAAVLALDLGPTGTSDSSILPRAVEAATLPAHSIVVVDSELTFDRRVATGSSEHYVERMTTWLLTTRDGHLARFRQLITDARGAAPAAPGTEEVAPSDHAGTSRRYDPRAGRSTTLGRSVRGVPTTAFALRVRRLLQAARSKPGLELVRRGAFVALDWNDRVSRFETTADEIRFDPRTYAPVSHRFSRRFRDEAGRIDRATVLERILSRHTLPDTPANRRLLLLRGPTR
jgi:hypothetical protein